MKVTALTIFLCCLAAAAFLLIAPQELSAGCRCGFATLTTQPTTGTWGLGSSCTAAHNDMLNNLAAAITCDTCYEQLEIKSACFFDTMKQMWREDGVIHYKCVICFEPNQ